GGMGDVYTARQSEPVRREVAFKIIKPGMDSRKVIARFDIEQQALAVIDHPNVARVFDGGATDTGRPYFVMELVQGQPINTYCESRKTGLTERLQLFLTVCHAIQHAHQKGIIHRDIKPSNVLVSDENGQPALKVIDFGLAKALQDPLTDDSALTYHGQIMGTPQYMSPEQAAGLESVDTQSDVYSLGALLFELLTGTPPITREQLKTRSSHETWRIVVDHPIPLASARVRKAETIADINGDTRDELASRLHGDLDAVLAKALEKDKVRRYQSIAALSADVERFLRHEPVEARAPSTLYRLQKYVRRNRMASGLVATVALFLITLLISAMWSAEYYRKQEQEQRRLTEEKSSLAERNQTLAVQAEHQRNEAHRNRYIADMRIAQQDLNAGYFKRAVQLLNHYFPKPGESDVRGWEWYYLLGQIRKDRQTIRLENPRIYGMAWHPDASRVAIASHGLLRSYKTEGGEIDWELKRRGLAHVVAWSNDGTRLAVPGPDNTIQIRSSRDGALLLTAGKKLAGIRNLAWSPDSRHVAILV
ncbi:MAG: serine/threonine-protein kinase, partial [Verrucomicrobiota bacterium]